MHAIRRLDAEWLFLLWCELDALSQVQVQRSGHGITRIDGLCRVKRLSLVVIRQINHGANRNLIGGTIRIGDCHIVDVLVAWLRTSRRGYRNLTCDRINLVGPSIDFCLLHGVAVLVIAEGEGRLIRRVVQVDGALDLSTRLGGLHLVGRLVNILLLGLHRERCQNSVGGAIQVRHRDRNVDTVARLRVLRGSRADDTILVNADLPAGNVLRNAVTLRWVSIEVALGNLRLIGNERVNCLARSGGLQPVLWLVHLVLPCNHHNGGDGAIRGTILVRHTHRNISRRAWKGILTNRRSDLARVRVDLDVLPLQVARRRNVRRILRVSDDGELGLCSITQVRAVDGTRNRRSGLPSHRRVGRAISARIGIHDCEVSRNLCCGTIRVGDLHGNGHSRSVGNTLIRGGSDGAVLVDGEGPVRWQLIRQLVLSKLRIGQLRLNLRAHRCTGLRYLRRV